MINSLQSLRGIFALIIFFHHFNFLKGQGGMFAAGGDAGVAFFFVLSGFVLSYGYENKIDSICNNISQYGYFIGKRISKLFPLHFLGLLWAIALVKFNFSIQDLLNFLFLQAWIPFPEWYFSGNSVGWCLSDFVFFYFLFPLIFMKIKSPKYQNMIKVTILIYIFILIPLVPNNFIDGFIYINPISRLSDFLLGMLLFQVYKVRNKQLKSNTNIKFLKIFSIFLFLGTVYLWYFSPERYRLNILWWPSVCFIIYLFSLESKVGFLNNKLLVWFGDMSFSFYLVHALYIRSFDIFLNKFNLVLPPFIRLFLILSSLILFSYIIKSLYEKPMEKFIRNLFWKRDKQKMSLSEI